jgi:hypothetical protein
MSCEHYINFSNVNLLPFVCFLSVFFVRIFPSLVSGLWGAGCAVALRRPPSAHRALRRRTWRYAGAQGPLTALRVLLRRLLWCGLCGGAAWDCPVVLLSCTLSPFHRVFCFVVFFSTSICDFLTILISILIIIF